MPSPGDLFELMKSDLEKIGITVTPKPAKWAPDYIDATEAGGCELHLLGWTGDFNDAYNFIGTWFAEYDKQWGFKDKKVFEAMEEASKEVDHAKRVKLYERANEVVMDYLPGVPVSSSPLLRSPSPRTSTRRWSPR